MRRNPCDIYIYVYLVNPIIFFSNSELNQMCDVGWTHMFRTQRVVFVFCFFFPLTQIKLEHINKSVSAAAAAAGGLQAAHKQQNSTKIQSCAQKQPGHPFTPPFEADI